VPWQFGSLRGWSRFGTPHTCIAQMRRRIHTQYVNSSPDSSCAGHVKSRRRALCNLSAISHILGLRHTTLSLRIFTQRCIASLLRVSGGYRRRQSECNNSAERKSLDWRADGRAGVAYALSLSGVGTNYGRKGCAETHDEIMGGHVVIANASQWPALHSAGIQWTSPEDKANARAQRQYACSTTFDQRFSAAIFCMLAVVVRFRFTNVNNHCLWTLAEPFSHSVCSNMIWASSAALALPSYNLAR
jgi:hypothetical protein